ncbi:MAG: homoserine dehydrogenase, partial [Mogibacterium sp.]|nr:homoserine dehydrogenase [Mogibacterium sp.]
MSRKIKVGMLGIGNVGRGTYQALEMNRELIAEKTGLDIEIVKILNRSPEKDRGIEIPKEKYTADVQDILKDPEIDIVAELIGGIEPATTYMAEALANGKHVVTANKAAIAANGEKLAALAQENKVLLRFEAAVAGGIPILSSLTGALLSNEFTQVHGILNGTTNYILTQMSMYGKSYEDVLKDAQEKGFAEADPTADVEGLDAANKLSILISLIFGTAALPEDIPTRGITTVSNVDIQYAEDAGYKIKLLGSAERVGDKVYGNVEPVLLPCEHPLASVNNEFNAVFVNGNAVDELMFYGRGAGPL